MTRHTYEYVKKYIEDKNYKLLSKKYKNGFQLLDIECSNGHIFKEKFHEFKRVKNNCPECYVHKYNFEFVKSQFDKKGYTLLSTKYKSCDEKLNYICKKGHKTQITFYYLYKRNQGCKKCSHREKCDKQFHKYDYVKQQFELRGYKLLDSEYKDSNTHLNYICTGGHKTKITFSHFVQGKGCKKCHHIKNKESQKHTLEFIISEFEKREFTLLSDNYKNARSRLNFMCNYGHFGEICYADFRTSIVGCSECLREKRNYVNETKCQEILKSIFNKPFTNGKPEWLGKLELDCYNEEFGFALEYNGKQHYEFVKHFHRTPKGLKIQQKRDKRKNELCDQNNIKLISVPYTVPYDKLEEDIEERLAYMRLDYD